MEQMDGALLLQNNTSQENSEPLSESRAFSSFLNKIIIKKTRKIPVSPFPEAGRITTSSFPYSSN